MKRLIKRMVSLVLVAALSCGLFASIPVSAATLQYDKKVTSYLGAKSSKYGYMHAYAEIDLTNCKAKPKNIKTSSSNLAASLIEYDSSKKTARILTNTKKAGTYTVSFTVKGKKYKSTVVFKKHTCPASTIKVTGVKSGKNIASYTENASTNSGQLKIKNNVSKAKLTVTTKKNWKLTDISLARYKNGKLQATMVNKSHLAQTGTKTYTLGKLNKNRGYILSLGFVNMNNGGTVYLEYYINT